MDPNSVTDICILLVEPDSSRSENTLKVLLDAKYRVVKVYQGAEALHTVQERERKVDLVLMPTKLPDMCPFECLDILESKHRMPVVMMCDANDGPTMVKFLLRGAMYCLVKPLCLRDVKNLWQHFICKNREVFLESCEFPISGVAEKEAGIREAKEMEILLENRLQSRNRMIEKLDKAEGSSMESRSSFTWTPSLHAEFINIVWNLGVYGANTPFEVIRQMSVPGLTIEFVMARIQDFQIYLERQELQMFSFSTTPTPIIAHNQANIVNQLMGQDIYTSSGPAFIHQQCSPFSGFLQNPQCLDQLNRNPCNLPAEVGNYADLPIFREMQTLQISLLSSMPPLPLVPTLSQLPPAPVPLANSAQRLFQPSWSSTVSEVPSLSTLPPTPGQGEDGSEYGDQVQFCQFFP